MSASEQTIHHIAKLARLNVADEDLSALSEQLSTILKLADQMQAVDTETVKPLSHPQDPSLRLREDTITESDRSAEFLALSEHSKDGLYTVPKVIE